MSNHKPSVSIVWFRQDLRLEDNPALQAAIDLGYPILPLYILSSQEEESLWTQGGASNWWLHHALKDLECELQKHSLRLIIRRGNALKILQELIQAYTVQAYTVQAIFWNRCYEPQAIARDKEIKEILKKCILEVTSFNGSLLFEPHLILNKTSKPFQVFTPFWKHCLIHEIKKPIKVNFAAIHAPQNWPVSINLEELQLLPQISWDKGLQQFWDPTTQGAAYILKEFLQKKIDHYEEDRNFPGLDGTSRLSPYLHFGQISPRQVWYAIQDKTNSKKQEVQKFLAEIGWREFAYYLLYHFPHTTHQPLQEKFKSFPWQYDSEILKRWQQGMTGYPIVDAGMRQLWQIGWMHNRVRMIVASFLVKHLQQSWIEGSRWFWDTLVDADLASNTLGWQWSAGCGADAAPYFRIFNPILQSQKFDPEGMYIKKYIPELAKVPNRFIHAPWEAPTEVLQGCNVELGTHYPLPIVDHEFARKRALEAFDTIKNKKV